MIQLFRYLINKWSMMKDIQDQRATVISSKVVERAIIPDPSPLSKKYQYHSQYACFDSKCTVLASSGVWWVLGLPPGIIIF